MEGRGKDTVKKSGWIYPEYFKIKVVKEIENGLLQSKDAARRKYGIGGKTTVLSWCRKYGRENYPYMPGEKKQRLQTADDKDKRIAKLEALLKQKELALDALESLIEVANEMYGTNLKKKVGIRRSKK